MWYYNMLKLEYLNIIIKCIDQSRNSSLMSAWSLNGAVSKNKKYKTTRVIRGGANPGSAQRGA